ncbi:hypothetical protein BDV93DRAFT_547777 [Ceratobasidium sp. AG-I]|nr:hypothetical protein BDV93DRAFT_547777 [Ceratobasidium sp. AG-I]
MLLSTCLWFGSFAMLSTSSQSDAVHISKFVMWGVATAIEVAGHAFVPSPNHLRSMGSLTARLATLVTIILGEGLNAITGTHKFAVASLGFNGRSAGLVLATAVVVYLTFYLYFEGTRPRISKNRRELWIFLHLPYMLCVILFLEGLKNLLLYALLYNSYDFVYTKFVNTFNSANQLPDSQYLDALRSEMAPFLNQIGVSWESSWKLVYGALEEANLTEIQSVEKYYVELYRFMMNITVKVFESFGPENITPSGRLAVLEYLQNDSLPLADSDPEVNGIPNLMAVFGYGLLIGAMCNARLGCQRVGGAAGHGSSMDQWACYMPPDSGDYRMDESSGTPTVWAWLDSQWTLPTLALSLVIQTIVDHILPVLSVRSADRALERTYQPSELDPLRDAKDHAYDPPIPASHFAATPTAREFTASATTLHTYNDDDEGNWQPAYVPAMQGHEGTSPHPQHQTSYGFPPTQTAPTGSK